MIRRGLKLSRCILGRGSRIRAAGSRLKRRSEFAQILAFAIGCNKKSAVQHDQCQLTTYPNGRFPGGLSANLK